MPDTLTHYIFGLDTTKDIIDSPLYKIIKTHRNLFFIGLQGPDPFYYHAPYKKMNHHHIGTTLHTKHTGHFLSSALCFAKKHTDDPDSFNSCMAYISGLLCHYTLDIIAHPYIFYLGGYYDKNNPDTHKYQNLHKNIELAIDALLLEEKYNMPVHKFKIHQHVIKPIKIPTVILEMYDELLFSIYAVPQGGKAFKDAYHDYQTFFKVSYDRLGLKKNLSYSLKPFLPKNLASHADNFSYYNCIDEFIDYLNPTKTVWLHPVTGNLYTYSFKDLMHNAHKQSRQLLLTAYEFTQSNETLEDLESILPDVSYLTGLALDDLRPMQYFKHS